MKEWKAKDAIQVITTILCDNILEEHLSDSEIERIACLIVQELEKEDA